MTILQLNPSIPVVTPKGKAMAILVIDYSIEHDLLWTCVINETGEIWTYRNNVVLADSNITLGRFPTTNKD